MVGLELLEESFVSLVKVYFLSTSGRVYAIGTPQPIDRCIHKTKQTVSGVEIVFFMRRVL